MKQRGRKKKMKQEEERRDDGNNRGRKVWEKNKGEETFGQKLLV